MQKRDITSFFERTDKYMYISMQICVHNLLGETCTGISAFLTARLRMGFFNISLTFSVNLEKMRRESEGKMVLVSIFRSQFNSTWTIPLFLFH